MYHLVNDVDSYSQFVPFCQRSGVESIDGSEVTAFLEINFGGIIKKLKTKNTLTPTSNIKVDLVEGQSIIWLVIGIFARCQKIVQKS